MLKSRCVLQAGGPLHVNRLDDLFLSLRASNASYISCNRSLVSLNSTPQDALLRYIEQELVEFIFQDVEAHSIGPRLQSFLRETGLDYRWSWEGFFRIEPGMICRDGKTEQTEQFLAIGDRIVLSADEIDDDERCAAVRKWSRWSPRTLVTYSTSHELIETHMQTCNLTHLEQ